MPKGLQSRHGQIIHRFLQSGMIEPLGNSAGCSCDQSHGSVWGTSVMHQALVTVRVERMVALTLRVVEWVALIRFLFGMCHY